jgi:hypothetical protein
VRIAFDPKDLSRVGTVVEMSNDEARALIREGRAVELPAGTKAELRKQAEAAGVEVPASATKDELAAAVAEAAPPE